jgi:hypothetical protein
LDKFGQLFFGYFDIDPEFLKSKPIGGKLCLRRSCERKILVGVWAELAIQGGDVHEVLNLN